MRAITCVTVASNRIVMEKLRGILGLVISILFILLKSDIVYGLQIGAKSTNLGNWRSTTTRSQSCMQHKGVRWVVNAAKPRESALFMSLDKGPGGAKNEKGPPKKKPKDDVVQVDGRVVESLPNAMFRVEIQPSKQIVLATISGKIRKNFVRIVVGDSVVCELSAYDLTKGRITYRNK